MGVRAPRPKFRRHLRLSAVQASPEDVGAVNRHDYVRTADGGGVVHNGSPLCQEPSPSVKVEVPWSCPVNGESGPYLPELWLGIADVSLVGQA